MKSCLVAALAVLPFLTMAQTAPSISDFEWLKGDWELKNSNGIIYESWSQVDATTLRGVSYKMQGADTVVLETVHLKCERGECAYIPIVSGQNHGQPVKFAITSHLSTSFVAENPAHDFPKKITYAREGSRMNASISGNGKEIRYPFTRR